MTDTPKVEKSKVDKLKDDSRPLVDIVRDFTAPDLLKIPKPNPRIHYRWGKNSTENLALLEAQGYRVANSDEVRECGFTPGADGAMHRGDLILCVEDWAYHKLKQKKKEDLARKQLESQRKGSSRYIPKGDFAGHPGGFQETVREA